MFYGCPTSEQNIRAGSRILFKPVPKTFPSDIHNEISVAINRVSGISDAYLTRCNLPYEDESRLVLVVGVDLDNQHQQHAVARQLMNELQPIRWNEYSIDILPFRNGTVPTAVLETGRKIG